MEGAILQPLVKLSDATTRVIIHLLLVVAEYARYVRLHMGLTGAFVLLTPYFCTFSSLNQFILTLRKLLGILSIILLLPLAESKLVIQATFGRGVLVGSVVGNGTVVLILLLLLVDATNRLGLLLGKELLLAASLTRPSWSVEMILRNVKAIRYLTNLLTIDTTGGRWLHLPLQVIHATRLNLSLIYCFLLVYLSSSNFVFGLAQLLTVLTLAASLVVSSLESE